MLAEHRLVQEVVAAQQLVGDGELQRALLHFAGARRHAKAGENVNDQSSSGGFVEREAHRSVVDATQRDIASVSFGMHVRGVDILHGDRVESRAWGDAPDALLAQKRDGRMREGARAARDGLQAVTAVPRGVEAEMLASNACAVQMFEVAFSRLMCCSRVCSASRNAGRPAVSVLTPTSRPGNERAKRSLAAR